MSDKNINELNEQKEFSDTKNNDALVTDISTIDMTDKKREAEPVNTASNEAEETDGVEAEETGETEVEEVGETEVEETGEIEAEEAEETEAIGVKKEVRNNKTGKKTDGRKNAKTLDDVYAGTEELQRINESGKATAGLKIAGIMSIIMAILGAVLVFVCIYHLVIKPSYIKDNDAANLHFPYVHTDSDAYQYLIPPLGPVATSTDASTTDSNSEIEADRETE